MFSWFLRSLTRGSLRLSLMMLHITKAADFAGLLAWRSCLPATFPRRRPSFSTSATPQWPASYIQSAIVMRSTPAIQSRGGDGFSCECNRDAVARLPEHEVCDDCRGRGRHRRTLCPLLGYSAPRLFTVAGLTYIHKIKIVPRTSQTTR